MLDINLRDALVLLMEECHGQSERMGWWKNLRTNTDHLVEVRHRTELGNALVGAKLMLVVSEVAEAMEGHRKGKMDEHLPHLPSITVELADAIIRICDLGGALNLDLGRAVEEKLAYNAQRPDHKIEARQGEGGKAY